jgi:isoaspartyl peptidase/L-asparaginase-like protein (Ntn-hydrolase superfamily)
MSETWRIATHGGAGSEEALTPETEAAADVAREALAEGHAPLEAACRAVAHLEDGGQFNAGAGSYVRGDGDAIQMDAACADSIDRFGAVACIEDVANPVLVARDVTETEHLVLAGRGAQAFARRRDHAEVDPRQRRDPVTDESQDTVGCVLHDGDAFAAALSSGGTEQAMVGRVGDVPLPGCGLRAGAAGAVAATGHGEAIARARLADQAYRALADGVPASRLVTELPEAFEEAVGLVAVTGEGAAGGANRSMAYAVLEP